MKKHPESDTNLQPPDWSPKNALDFMAQNSISTSILSFAYTLLYDSALCQEINTYAYKLRLQYPIKFGFFATLPSITEASLPEVLSSIKFCYENLKTDGVTLVTSYEGKYLGDELFRPVFEELNRLHAVVLIHPTALSTIPGHAIDSSIPQMVDFVHEITRTAYSLIYSNTMSTYPNVKIILSHGGGTLPYLSSGMQSPLADSHQPSKTAVDFHREARMFYVTSTNSSNLEVEHTERFFGPERMIYGSNFPCVKESSNLRRSESWRQPREGNEPKKVQAMRETTLKLFPRLGRGIEKEGDSPATRTRSLREPA